MTEEKPTAEEMRQTLNNDPLQSVINTYMEYADTDVKPAGSRADLITLIIAMMEGAGDLRSEGSVKLPDLAREIGVHPKVARDKIRKAAAAGKPVPESLRGTGWTFRMSDRAAVLALITPRKKDKQ